MKEMGIQAYQAIAAGVLMAILTLMMVTGLGSKRGTWLNGVRLCLWTLVMGLGGAAACGGTEYIGKPDGAGEPDMDTRYPPDTVEETNDEDWPFVECYAAPMDPGPDAPEDVPPDGEGEPDDVVEDGAVG